MFVALYVSVFLAFQTNCLGALIQVDDDILNRINKLEAADNLASKRIEDLERAIVDLEMTVQRKEDRIKDLEKLVKTNYHNCISDLTQLDGILKELETKHQTCRSDIKLLDERLTGIENKCKTNQMNDYIQIGDQEMEDVVQTEYGESNQTVKSSHEVELEQSTTNNFDVSGTARDTISKRKKTARRNAEGTIAFTAILEEPADRVQHIGLNQVIKYNKIITNVGNSYSIHSGIFTVPTNGLYLFHYTAATGWESEDLWVRLMVDSSPQNGAVAVSVQLDQVVQAGNVAILSLRQGQVVWVETFMADDVHIYSAYGINSFSGVLLSEN